MIFTDKDIIKFKTFCQEIIGNPRPMDEQPSQKYGGYLWCEDWEIIEILKYLFNGRDGYHGDPPPNRLKNNPLWSKDEIEKKAEMLMSFYQNSDHIIENLRSLRNGTASRIA